MPKSSGPSSTSGLVKSIVRVKRRIGLSAHALSKASFHIARDTANNSSDVSLPFISKPVDVNDQLRRPIKMPPTPTTLDFDLSIAERNGSPVIPSAQQLRSRHSATSPTVAIS